MVKIDDGVTRRHFLQTTMVAAGAAAFPYGSLLAKTTGSKAKYTRYNVMSPQGQQALKSYNKAVTRMLALDPKDPHNWFRIAFIHLMDCPHGNWWFYVWHRGYLGFLEEIVRKYSDDPTFAMPYWDWTAQAQPQIPAAMFDGALDPMNPPFQPYTRNLDVFTAFIKPTMKAHWDRLNDLQYQQLRNRSFNTFDDLWRSVTEPDKPGDRAFAPTDHARYLTRANPKLNADTAYDVSPFVIHCGLQAPDFNNMEVFSLSFTSTKAKSHNATPAPSTGTLFSTLEGLPHNKTHNYIGGAGAISAPFGNMTNNLSPVDPIFFLHHSNMDRLWDVWTRKQIRLGRDYLPTGNDLTTFSNEPFLFFVDPAGHTVAGKAGDYVSTAKPFDYDYEPGSGENVATAATVGQLKSHAMQSLKATVKENASSLTVPRDVVRKHLSGAESCLMAEVTVESPSGSSPTREFDVIVGAPEGVTQVEADSPYYAGTIAFFGHMHHAGLATFAVPLPKKRTIFRNLEATNVTVNIRVIPAHAGETPTALKAVTVRVMQ
ncbi:MAG TPA: tyrosinase family protein [Thermoanaerobaculia bacterium]|jgi:tyrosinase|nr:tyrosinase family protein [Thermoanaerobaculia bacterium]